MSKFGENFKKLREEKKLTQVQLARRLRVKQQLISAWETGDHFPRINKIKKIMDFFGVGFVELTGL